MRNINVYRPVLPDTVKPALTGGRDAGLAIITKIRSKHFAKYDAERDIPALDKTTKLSAYLKFGCISIREALEACVATHGLEHGLVRELFWREFYAYIAYHHRHILRGQVQPRIGNSSFNATYASLTWKPVPDALFQAWCNGNTGFPIVDAAMICMNRTGWMHNRLRMIVASFFCKDLLGDWRVGERYFASRLIDYDPASNNGGWQWIASTGTDAQPYFRVFNPWLQSKKYDPKCDFIKKWIPALRKVPSAHIHEWHLRHGGYSGVRYPAPILDHSKQSKAAVDMFKERFVHVQGGS